MVISYSNQKGGVGKTTLALHTAWELAQDGGRGLLMDADPQGSASDWVSQRTEVSGMEAPFSVVGCARVGLYEEVERFREIFDWIVLDGPPREDGIASACLAAADLVVVPLEPSVFSSYAAEDIFKLLDKVRVFRPRLASRLVINRKIPGSVIGREWRDLVSGAEVLRAEVTQRVDFAKAVGEGMVVQEYAAGGAAAREVSALVDELRAVCAGLAAELDSVTVGEQA